MDILSFILYSIIITATPGPTNIFILSTVNNIGVKKAIEFAYGAWAAFFVLLIMSITLNTILLTILPKIIIAMQYIGSIYILYLAYKIYKMDSATNASNHYASFKTGFLMQFINPKPVLFTLTVIPSFVMPYYTSFQDLAAFVLLLTIICFIAFATWIFFGTLLKSFFQKHQKIINIIMALFLVYSAIMVSGVVNYLQE